MKNQTERGILRLLTWVIRILTGLTFIVSGFVKGIDPYGTFYKLEEYLGAMSLPVFPNLLLVGAFVLFAYEFIVGVFLLLGCFRKSSPILALLFMALMLPLTLWIAVWNPVEDCGCFGDAIKLGNWATFWKNIVLTAAIIWLLKFNSRCKCLIRPSLQWLALLGSAVYIATIGLFGYLYQPLIDFRPYRAGEPIMDFSQNIDEDSSEEETLRFIYAKDGVEKSFSIDDELPDEESGWVFVRREEEPAASTADSASSIHPEESQADYALKEKNFRVWSEDGEEDVTEEVLHDTGRQMLLLIPDMSGASIAGTWQINSLYSWAEENDIDFIAIVNGTEARIADWKDLSLAAYPIYTSDDTEIKMIARGNPAIVYLENGIVKWKSSLRALSTKDFQASGASSDPMAYARHDKLILYNITGFYLLLILLLIGASIIPVKDMFRPHWRTQLKLRKRISHGDKEDHEE